ncbi:MAG: hypothetical protein GOP50_13400 [Candidatus Heimdallarchaeota archaeon]|nr:hypothetical protein [Candidatus Heimdallarchaeota archaeon]
MNVTTRRKKDIELDIRRIQELNLSGEDTLKALCQLMDFMSSFQTDSHKKEVLKIDLYLRDRRNKKGQYHDCRRK